MSLHRDVEMLPEEEYPLYYTSGSKSPLVELEVEDEWLEFLVDTGAHYSAISLKQIKEWGWEDQIIPDDIPKRPRLGEIKLIIKIKNVEFDYPFAVIDFDQNLLGTDTMGSLNTIIDLHQQKLIFREITVLCICGSVTQHTVTIAGQEVSVMVDTGYSGFISGTLELAQQLHLPLEETKDTVTGVLFGEAEIPYQAHDVCIQAYGQEKRAEFDVNPLEDNDDRPVLGAKFLQGARIYCSPLGELEVSFPNDSVPRPLVIRERKRGEVRAQATLPSAAEETRDQENPPNDPEEKQPPGEGVSTAMFQLLPTVSPGGRVAQGRSEEADLGPLILTVCAALLHLQE